MSIAGAVLVGGQSQRMGQTKALLSFKGKRLIDHMASLLKDLNLPIYVSGQDIQYVSFPDPISFQGPLYGIYNSIQQLSQLGYKAALFVPVDMPFLTREVLSGLMQQNKDCDIVYYNQHPLPLFITFTQSILDDVSQNFPALNSGKSLHSYLKRNCSKQLQIKDHSTKAFTNANTPEEWCRILES